MNNPTDSSATTTTALPSLPVSSTRLSLRRSEFEAGGVVSLRFQIENPHTDNTILHIRFPAGANAARVIPEEAALGPGEKQSAILAVDAARAKAFLNTGAGSGASLQVPVAFTYLRESSPPTRGDGFLYVRLPVAACPNCSKIVTDDDAHGDHGVPEVCPYCFERLRACPTCGAPNSWLARRCIADDSHIVRAEFDWPIAPGGDAAHSGNRSEVKANIALSRRWSYPNVAPARRENALFWTAPVAAYGLVTAASSDHEGDASVQAWDARTGAPLWDSYPLPDPVYPERGGVALAGGKLFLATVEGVCICLDALRGTRAWETHLPRQDARVFGAVLPVRAVGEIMGDATPEADLILICATLGEKRDTGMVFVLSASTGQVLREIPLPGAPDTAPAFADGRAYVHDDSGKLTAMNPVTGETLWQEDCGAGFDAAPVVAAGSVFSATSGGELLRHDAATGELVWRLAVTNAPLSGTPACDGSLVYVPADDGLHVISASTGRSVRRFGTRRPVRAAPVVAANGVVFWGATDGNIYGVRGGGVAEQLYATGTVGSQIMVASALADGALFITATNGVLYALEK